MDEGRGIFRNKKKVIKVFYRRLFHLWPVVLSLKSEQMLFSFHWKSDTKIEMVGEMLHASVLSYRGCSAKSFPLCSS